MHHLLARQSIESILAGQGFDQRALSTCYATLLAEVPGVPEGLPKRALDACCRLPPDLADSIGDSQHFDGGDLDQGQICGSLVDQVLARPARSATQIACLCALVEFWPHASKQERPFLRQRFMRSLLSRTAPSGSHTSVEELSMWQRHSPTIVIQDQPKLSHLRHLLDEADPDQAYYTLAEHLGPGTDWRQLSRVLGTLAVHILLQHKDKEQQAQKSLLASMAAERLLSHCPLSRMATLLSFLGHQLWWCRNHHELRTTSEQRDDSEHDLASALASGNLRRIRRSARTHCTAPSFWPTVWLALESLIEQRQAQLPLAIQTTFVIASRAGGAPPSPDDAAVLCQSLLPEQHQTESCSR